MGVAGASDTEHQPHARHDPNDPDSDDGGGGDVAEQHMNPMAARGMRKSGTLKMTEWVRQRNMSHRKKSQIMVRQPGGVSGEDDLVVPAHHAANPAAGAAEDAGWKELTDNSSGAPRSYCPSEFCRTLFQIERRCIAQLRPGSSFPA